MLLVGAAAAVAAPSMEIVIDATELPRHLLHATVTLPADGDQTWLWYPKWVPGVHAPGGPVQNLAGLLITDADGDTLDWHRDPAEAYRIRVDDTGSGPLTAHLRYITDQPSTNSDGVDAFGSDAIGVVNANTVLLVREGDRPSDTRVRMSLIPPDGWEVSTSLEIDGDPGEDGRIDYRETTLERLVDAPFLLGRHRTTYDLVDEAVADRTPRHTLHVFSELETRTRIHETVETGYREMVTQATRLFESHPFPSFEILVGVSDVLQKNGLEHLHSSFNVVGLDAYESETSLSGWERMLIPHEYAHAWCGKFRRPQGMVTDDFHTPKDTRLLWVYEGLTQYLGTLLEVRSGLMTPEAFRWHLRWIVVNATYQQGRAWRTLEDTGAAAHLLRGWSERWGSLRRGQDFYYEGLLVWLEADARIRNLTDGERSLDDFCRLFFAVDDDTPNPHGYDRATVVATLNEVVEADWDAFIAARIERRQERAPLTVLDELGLTLQFSNERPEPPEGEDPIDRGDLRASVGATVWGNGTVNQVILGSPADAAGLAPGDRIEGVDGYVFDLDRLDDAVARSASTGTVPLLVVTGEKYETRVVRYDGGPRHPVLVTDGDAIDRLAEITAPLE